MQFKNVQPGKAAKNFLLSFSNEDNSVIPVDKSNHYLYSIPAWVEETWEVPVKVLDAASPSIYELRFVMQYQDEDGAAFDFSPSFSIEVAPRMRVQHDDLRYRTTVVQGEVLDFTLNVMNVGNGTIKNIILSNKIPALGNNVSCLLGDIAIGTAQEGTLKVYLKDNQEAKVYEGKVHLAYESETGQKYEEDIPVRVEVEKKVIYNPEEGVEQKETSPHSYLLPVTLGIINILFLILLFIQWYKIKKLTREQEAKL